MLEMAKGVQIMIVDDHVVVREGLKQILELEPDFEVVGIAGDGDECLELVDGGLTPDIIFMDLKMPRTTGITATRILTEKHPLIKVIMLTVYDDQQYVTQAIQAGARGYILKNADRSQLIDVVRRVLADKSVLDPKLTEGLFNTIRGGEAGQVPDDCKSLTKRELYAYPVKACIRKDHICQPRSRPCPIGAACGRP
jgi:DNA-binding NarL/FixJ family response regulator